MTVCRLGTLPNSPSKLRFFAAFPNRWAAVVLGCHLPGASFFPFGLGNDGVFFGTPAKFTPRKTNRFPEHQWLEDVGNLLKESLFFRGHVSFRGCNILKPKL